MAKRKQKQRTQKASGDPRNVDARSRREQATQNDTSAAHTNPGNPSIAALAVFLIGVGVLGYGIVRRASVSDESAGATGAAIATWQPPMPTSMAALEPALVQRINEFTGVAKAEPSSAEAAGRLGMLYEAHDHIDLAGACYARAIAIANDAKVAARWRHLRAALLVRQGRFTEAQADWEQVITAEPAFAPAHERLGHLLMERGDVEGALAAFADVVQLRIQAPNGYVGTARAQLEQGNIESAEVNLKRALQIAPDMSEANFLYGRLLARKGEHGLAQSYLAKGSDAEPSLLDDPWRTGIGELELTQSALLQQAAALRDDGRLPEAAAVLESIIKADPHNTAAMNNLASIYLTMGRHGDAKRVLEQALAVDEAEFGAHLNLAQALLSLGDAAGAVVHAERAAELAPDMGMVQRTRGQALAAAGRLDDAIAAYAKSIELEPQRCDVYGSIGELRLRARNWQQAIASLQRAAECTPDSALVQYNLGIAWAQSGNAGNARDAFARAKALAPGNPRLQEAIGKLEAQLGNR